MLSKDIDLTKDGLFSRDRKNLRLFISNTILDLKNNESRIDFENNYGTFCICCGDKIDYSDGNLDLWFFHELDNSFISNNENTKDLRELCHNCDARLKKEFSKKPDDFIYLLKESMVVKKSNSINLNFKNENNSIRKINDLYSKERNAYVQWALRNKINIWE